MRLLISVVICTLLVTACGSTRYQYQSQKNSAQFKGQSVQALQKQWGMADTTIQSRNGGTYYTYYSNSGTNFFNSTTTNFITSGPGADSSFPSNPGVSDMTLKCSTVFTANAAGIITNVTHKGSNCGGEWVPASSKKS